MNVLVKHVSRFRGKMLRPCLVLLSGRACSGDQPLSEAHTVIATVVEMVHMATLVHDDVLDEAELRRKGATINHLRGNEAAVLLGDYLISHSYHLCSGLDSQFASRLIGRTTNCVCEGELLQLDNRNNLDLDEQTYLQIIERKTASLCAACCLLGAKFAGAEPAHVAALETFGMSLGTAFQIQDDILDLVGDASCVGKTLGIDVEKGKLTLPLIHFLRSAAGTSGVAPVAAEQSGRRPSRADQEPDHPQPLAGIRPRSRPPTGGSCAERASHAGRFGGPPRAGYDGGVCDRQTVVDEAEGDQVEVGAQILILILILISFGPRVCD